MRRKRSAGGAKYKFISVNKLKFDRANPRFFGSTSDKKKGQTALHDELVKKYGALGLIDSLLANGFMPYEPLIVRPQSSQYIVIEGNRRLAAIKFLLQNKKRFNKSAKSPISNLRKIACIIFKERDINAKQREQTYLGLRHFSGYKHWSPKSKAQYLLHQLRKGVSPNQLAIRLNTTASRIKKYVIALELLSKGSKKISDAASQNLEKFWMLAEALQRTSIKEYIELNSDPDSFKVLSFNMAKFKKLNTFLYGNINFELDESDKELEPIISDTRQLSQLSEVLASEEAAHVLETTGNLSAALKLVNQTSAQVSEAHKDVIVAVRSFKNLDPTRIEKRTLLRAIKSILK